MGKSENYARFLVTMLLTSLLSYLFYFLLNMVLPLLSFNPSLELVVQWAGFSLSTILAISLSILIISYAFPSNNARVDSDSLVLIKENPKENPRMKILFKGFRFQKFGSQIKDGFLLFICIYIPLDFIGYLIPGVLDYSVNSLNAGVESDPNNYFLFDLPLMLVLTFVIHFFVALREEFLYRELFLTIGRKDMKSPNIFFLSALLFGLAHFNYIFLEQNTGKSFFYPLWWGLNGLIIGIFAAAYFWKNQRIFPVIFAHWMNNFLSAIVVRNFVLEISFWQNTFLYIYLPLLILAMLSIVMKWFKYSTLLKTIKENWVQYIGSVDNWKYYLADFGMLVILWILMSIA